MHDKLLKIQQEIGAIKKDSENPFFKSAYFDINGLLATIKPVLNKHGVVVLQPLTTDQNGKLAIRTILLSDKGDRIEDVCPVPEGSDAQKTGSAITYFRRYALQSFLALEAEDDDGNSASKPVAKAIVKPATKPVVKTINNSNDSAF